MKTLRWFLFNGFFCVIAYMWVAMGNENAGRFLIVMSWIMAVTSLIATSDKIVMARIEAGEIDLGVPAWVDFAYDCCFTVVFIYGGAHITGVAYFFHSIFCQMHHRALMKKLGTEQSAAV